jgi:hypothetical protein
MAADMSASDIPGASAKRAIFGPGGGVRLARYRKALSVNSAASLRLRASVSPGVVVIRVGFIVCPISVSVGVQQRQCIANPGHRILSTRFRLVYAFEHILHLIADAL